MRKCYVLGYSRNESTREAARWATEQVLPDGKLVIIHSTRDLHLPAPPATDAEVRRRLGRDVVDELLLEGEDAMFDVDVEVEVVDKDPVSALCEAGARHSAEAIVVGCEPRSRLRTAVGTVTVELLRRSPIPVIVMPSRADAARAEQKLDGSEPSRRLAHSAKRF
ncbi:MAG TPA: universal stress protein [Solirubrobacteraceae bacterium]|nr:universal stress protein [Solirubrobacteraceae bacterium]